MTAERDTLLDKMESLVDAVGMNNILALLEEIAELKAEHARANWQDEGAAREWERAARAILKAWQSTRV